MEKGTSEKLDLPKSNVLYFEMSGGIDFIIRPSGTEPKIKIYFLSQAETKQKADENIKNLKEVVLKLIDEI